MSTKIVFYVKSNGKAPVEECLKGLKNKRYLAKTIALIDKLGEENGRLPEPYSKKVINKIWELRLFFGGRIFYFSHIGKKIVLLDGITKKSNRIPKNDVSRIQDYFQDYKHNLKEKKYDTKFYH